MRCRCVTDQLGWGDEEDNALYHCFRFPGAVIGLAVRWYY